MPEWPKGADCKSAGVSLRRFKSFSVHTAGVAQLVELQPSKLVVEGSSPFARSFWYKKHRIFVFRPLSTVAVHLLGKEGVDSSILSEGSNPNTNPELAREHVEGKIRPQQAPRQHRHDRPRRSRQD